MEKVIIFKNKNGTVDIYNNPMDTVLGLTTVEQLMNKDGHPFIDKKRAEIEIQRKVIDGFKEENVRPFYERLAIGGATEKEAWNCLALFCQKEHHVSYKIVNISNLPSDRTFREAWQIDDSTKLLNICPTKAKEIKKNQLRNLRKPKLTALDVEYIQADESNDLKKKKEIVAKKQELRDITQNLPDDINELKSFMPNILL